MTDRAIRSQAWAGGSDAPEKSALDIGFMALTDSASLIVAATQGFAQPYGLTLNLRRQPSWATLRDKLSSSASAAARQARWRCSWDCARTARRSIFPNR